MSAGVALRTESLTKRYGGVVALAGVDVEFRAGQVTALLGENGAGKSTLVACCSGARLADHGSVYLADTAHRFATPHAAVAAGIAVVQQEPQMLDEQTVAQNINVSALLGSGARRIRSRRRLEERTSDQLDALGLAGSLDPARPVRTLSGAQRQLVEITRALVSEPKVLFLDEPNASLGDEETELLFAVVRRLQARDVAVVLISHRLHEVYRIADQVVVMRDGQKVADAPVGEFGINEAVALMGGRPRDEQPTVSDQHLAQHLAQRADVTPVLELRNVRGKGFDNVSLTIRPGEIVGMAGLVGAGRTELALGVIGATRLRDGEVLINGVPRRLRSPGDAVRHGVVYVAEDRREAIFYDKSIDFNVRASLLAPRRAGARRPRERRARALVTTLAEQLAVKAPSLDTAAARLSGGNQQKLLFARAISVEPKLLILDEPTHGVDIATRSDIHQFVRQLAADGMAVWIISSELDEVLDLATRILVLRQGRVAAEVAPGDDPMPILSAALGTFAVDQEPVT